MPRNCDSQVGFRWVPKLRVAAGLMVNHEAGSEQRRQDLARFQNWQPRRHLCTNRYAKLFLDGGLFIGDWLAIFLQSFKVAADGVASHFARLS